MQGATADGYVSGSAYLCRVAGHIGATDWGRPGLGEWTVLELVAHANRSHLLVEEYLHHPMAPGGADAAYFDPAAIAERARAAVVALGDDPLASVRQAASRAAALVAATPADAVLGTPFGELTLADYLPSRTAELVLHGDDLARALDLGRHPPADAMAQSLGWLAVLAERRGRQLGALRALSGRGGPGAGDFSVF